MFASSLIHFSFRRLYGTTCVAVLVVKNCKTGLKQLTWLLQPHADYFSSQSIDSINLLTVLVLELCDASTTALFWFDPPLNERNVSLQPVLNTCTPTCLHACAARLHRSYARYASDPDDAVLANAFAFERAAAVTVREGVYRPNVIPVTDWVTCVNCDPDTGLLLAGTYESELLLLGNARCC